MKRLVPVMIAAMLPFTPARAATVDLAPPFTGSFTAEGCSMDGRSLPFPGVCTVTHETGLGGSLEAGVSMSGFAGGAIPAVGRGESLAKLSVTDTIDAGMIPTYAATFTVLDAHGSRTGPAGGPPPAGATGDYLVHALLRVVDGRPRCEGAVHGALPGWLVSPSGALAPGATFTLEVATPPGCIRSSAANMTVEVSLFVRVQISDRGVLPGGAAGYEIAGLGSVEALGSVSVSVTRTA